MVIFINWPILECMYPYFLKITFVSCHTKPTIIVSRIGTNFLHAPILQLTTFYYSLDVFSLSKNRVFIHLVRSTFISSHSDYWCPLSKPWILRFNCTKTTDFHCGLKGVLFSFKIVAPTTEQSIHHVN